MRSLLSDRLLVLTATLLLGIGGLGASAALDFVGRPFPGFLVLENGVVASIGLSRWPATAGGDLYQQGVVAVDGAPVRSGQEVLRRARDVAVGTPLRYQLRGSAGTTPRSIPTRLFEASDFGLLFGLYLLNGAVLGAAGLAALHARHRRRAATAAAPALLIGALWVLSALDLYGPYRLFRLHALCEVFLFPAVLHIALGFPVRASCLTRRPWLATAPYLGAVVLAVPYQFGLHERSLYAPTHVIAVSAFGAALVTLIVSEVERYRRPATPGVRERIAILAVGAVLALSLPACLTLAEVLTGGRSPQNALALTTFLFPLAVGWAVLRDDLPEPVGPTKTC